MSKLITSKPLFIMLYGYPGAGKSFFARQLVETIQAALVQDERIRNELFDQPRYDKQENDAINQLMGYMTEQFLNAGVSVIYDANAMRAGQRRMLREAARKAHAEPLLIWVQIDVESAFARVARRDRRRTDDKYAMQLDRTTFEKLISNMQNPSSTEDYLVISGKHSFKTQQNSALKRLRELGLITPEATSDKLIKPELVNRIPNPAVGRVDLSRRNIVIR